MVPFLCLGGMTRPADWSSVSDFASWAAQQALRYAPSGVRLFELMNEPNLNGWTAQQYAQFVTAADTKIKAAVPDAVVIIGSLGVPLPDAFDYAKALYASGIAGHLDVFSVHASDDTQASGTWSMWNWAWGGGGTNDSIRALMDRNGDAAKPIIVSEYDLGPVPKYSESDEVTLVQHALTDTRPASVAVYTMMDDDVPGFGMLRLDRTQRPAWSAYQSVATS